MSLSPDTNGYLMTKFSNNGKRTPPIRIHRLTAETFVPNDSPNVKTIVHHKDGDILNNNYTNLIWVTPEEHKKIHNEIR